jgi:hypothetical protein
MPSELTLVEHHSCLICEKLYDLEVTYDRHGERLNAVALSEGIRVLPHPDRPLVVCAKHSGVEVGAALAKLEAEAAEHDHDHDHD